MKLGCRHNYHKGWAALRIYANQFHIYLTFTYNFTFNIYFSLIVKTELSFAALAYYQLYQCIIHALSQVLLLGFTCSGRLKSTKSWCAAETELWGKDECWLQWLQCSCAAAGGCCSVWTTWARTPSAPTRPAPSSLSAQVTGTVAV